MSSVGGGVNSCYMMLIAVTLRVTVSNHESPDAE